MHRPHLPSLLSSFLCLLLVLAGLGLAAPVMAAPKSLEPEAAQPLHSDDALPLNTCAKTKVPVRVSFRPNTKLEELVAWAMSFTCENFVYRSGIGSRSTMVDIIAPSKLTAHQAWRLFQVAVHSIGLTIIDKGPVLEIVELAQAPKSALPIARGSGGGEAMERLLVQPEHIGAEDTQRALSALSSAQGSVLALPEAGALLVTDFGTHTRRMAQLLRHLDRPSAHEGLYAIHLEYADTAELAKQLETLLAAPESGPAQGGERPRKTKKGGSSSQGQAPSLILGDERTSTILLRSSKATYLRALAIASELDRKLAADSSSQIHVYPLQHADAAKLATTLSALTQQEQGSKRSNGPRGAEAAAAISGAVSLSADIETNSLLVRATISDYHKLKKLIAGLDRSRPQVFIELTIFEVDIDRTKDFGGSFHVGSSSSGSLLLGGSQLPGSRTAPLSALQGSVLQDGLIAGALGSLLPSEKFLGVSIPSYALLFQAIAEDRRIDIVSAPKLMTTSNSEAKLSVGQNVPYQAGISAPLTPGGPISENIKRQDVEMTVQITPHVNHEGMVRLELDLNIKELLPNQAGLHPSWTTRTITNTVVVGDQESIVIGGLTSSKESRTHNKIPLLGDIPLLGHLFKSSHLTKSKKNLLVLLTPYVLGSVDEARRLTRRKALEREEFLRSTRSLRRDQFSKEVDYRKKRGLIAEIAAEVEATAKERDLLEELETRVRQPSDGPLRTLPESAIPSAEPEVESGEDGPG